MMLRRGSAPLRIRHAVIVAADVLRRMARGRRFLLRSYASARGCDT